MYECSHFISNNLPLSPWPALRQAWFLWFKTAVQDSIWMQKAVTALMGAVHCLAGLSPRIWKGRPHQSSVKSAGYIIRCIMQVLHFEYCWPGHTRHGKLPRVLSRGGAIFNELSVALIKCTTAAFLHHSLLMMLFHTRSPVKSLAMQ